MRTDRLWKVIALILAIIAGSAYLSRKERVSQHLSRLFREMKVVSLCGFVVMVAFDSFVFRSSAYLIHICLMAGLYSILALGLNFQLGSTNVVNFATAASYGIGAYTSAFLAVHFHISFWPGLLIGGGVASFFGIPVRIPLHEDEGLLFVPCHHRLWPHHLPPS